MEQNIYSFSGSFTYLIDQKNRLNIPAKFRKELGPENDNTFVICKGFDACLYAYPATEWDRVQSQLMSLNNIKSKHKDEYLRSIKALKKQNSPKQISAIRNKKISEIIEKRG